MNVKKAAYDEIVKLLEAQRDFISRKIRGNKVMIRDLVRQQTILKREREPLTTLIRELKGKS